MVFDGCSLKFIIKIYHQKAIKTAGKLMKKEEDY